MEKWYWVELIGFDNSLKDFGVKNYLSRISQKVSGVSLFLYSSDFITSYEKYNSNSLLNPEFCSYAAHPFNEERKRQVWSYSQLKGLVKELKKYGVSVLFSTFSTFIYRNKNGKVIVGKFGDSHLDIRENITCKLGNFGSVSPIKRFQDGYPFYKFLIEQIKKIISDFGFDGVHFADGLSFPIRRIQDGDFSDDLVLRFINKNKISLPQNISGACDGDNERLLNRYNYILANLRAEYSEFIASLYSEFYKYASFALKNKKVLFMGAWTRDPFECLFRYGIDNKTLNLNNAYAYVFENMGASMAVFSKQESGGVDFSEDFRKDVQYHFFMTLSSLKSYTPNANVINLTPIKDTFEQWNLIENNPNGLAKGIALRNSNFIYSNKKLLKSTFGAMYCLADGLNSNLWNFVNSHEKISNLSKINKVFGCGFVFNDNLSRELKTYVSTRRLFSHEIRKRIISAGTTLSFSTDIKSLPFIDQPLIVTGIENYSKYDLDKLSLHKGTFAVIGYQNPLNIKPVCTVKLKNSTLKCDFYNLSKKYKNAVIDNVKEEVDLSPFDEFDGIWTAKLKFEKVNPEFFSTISKIINAENIPLTDKPHCRVMLFDLGKKYRLYVYNNSCHFEYTTITLPVKISKAKALFNKSAVQKITENSITVKLFNDGVEILEISKGE